MSELRRLYQRLAAEADARGRANTELEFSEAQANLDDLVAEYMQYQEAGLEEDEEVAYGEEELPDEA